MTNLACVRHTQDTRWRVFEHRKDTNTRQNLFVVHSHLVQCNGLHLVHPHVKSHVTLLSGCTE